MQYELQDYRSNTYWDKFFYWKVLVLSSLASTAWHLIGHHTNRAASGEADMAAASGEADMAVVSGEADTAEASGEANAVATSGKADTAVAFGEADMVAASGKANTAAALGEADMTSRLNGWIVRRGHAQVYLCDYRHAQSVEVSMPK